MLNYTKPPKPDQKKSKELMEYYKVEEYQKDLKQWQKTTKEKVPSNRFAQKNALMIHHT